VEDFREEAGGGIEGRVDGIRIRCGSAAFAGTSVGEKTPPAESRIYVSIGDDVKGYFAVKAGYRTGIGPMLLQLGRRGSVALLSGDNAGERETLSSIFAGFSSMHFHQSPMDKLRFVQSLQARGRRVVMIGDGLNDAGALRQSETGIAVTEEAGLFSPACDAILEASKLGALPDFLSFASASVRIVHAAFAFSFLYNLIGLWFAVQGALSPVMAAVLMPLSSITVVLFATLSTRYAARKRGL
ncbi:MAG: HAD-IC family P-type ATPase, partial [Acidobacteriota bacterium]